MTAQAASRSTYTPPKTFNFKQLEELWVLAGGPLAEAPIAASVALAESAGNPNAVGKNSNGSVDRGLWQINSVHGALSTTNVEANVKAAVKIHKESGWSPWVTFKTGAYKRYYQQKGIPLEKGAEAKGLFSQAGEFSGSVLEAFGFGAATNVGAKIAGQPAPSTTVGKQIRAGEKPVEEAFEKGPGWLKEVFAFIGKEAVTAVLLLAGAVLVVYGIMVAVRPRQSALSVPLPAIA